MERISKTKAGLTLGVLVAAMHLVWTILVGIGWAQGLMTWIFKMHMMNNPYVVADFNWGIAIGLIVVTFIVGYIVGFVFAALWNNLKK